MKKKTVLAVILIIIFIFFAGEKVFPQSDPALVGHWSMNEGTGNVVNDLSGNGNHGILHGAQFDQGVEGTALFFDGIDDYVQIPHSPSLTPPNGITVMFWAKPNKRQYANIVVKFDSDLRENRGYMVSYMGPEYGQTRYVVDTQGPPFFLDSPDETPFNEWSHFSMTYDGSTLIGYRDGVEKNRMVLTGPPGPEPGPINHNSHPMIFGARYDVYPTLIQYFGGYLDEVLIYNEALTVEEIQAHYEANAPPPSPPIAHWPMDEGQSTTVQDMSGRGHHGTIQGSSAEWDWVDGVSGNALSFDGSFHPTFPWATSPYVYVPNHADFNFGTGSLTIEAWAKLDGFVNQGYGEIIIGTNWGSARGVVLGFGINDNNYHLPTFWVMSGAENMITGQEMADIDTWYHLVGVRNTVEDKIQIYVNGVLAGEKTDNSGHLSSTHWAISGQHTWVGRVDGCFHGIIDEVSIYDRALTAEEVLEHFQQYPTNTPPTANAGPDQIVECTSCCATEVTLDGTGSTDPDSDPITYYWTWDGGSAEGPTPTFALPLGETTITLVVNDGQVDSEPDSVDITVEDTTPPFITAPDDITKGTDEGKCTAVVTFEVTATDNCDTDVELEVTPASGTAFALGETTVTCTATDDVGNLSTATFKITVFDDEAPIITLDGNNPLNVIRFSGPYTDPGADVTDNCDPAPSLVTSGVEDVNTNLPGTYSIAYNAADLYGNEAEEVFRTVNVIDDPDALIHPYLFLSDKKIMVDKMGQAEGNMHSNDEIDIKKGPATFVGDVTACGKIDIAKDITIDGDVTAGGELQLDNNVTITGTAIEYADVSEVLLPQLSYSAGSNDVKIKKNKSKSLTPGSYGKIEAEKKATLQLSTGVYFIEELILKEKVRFEIDVSTGPVTVNVVKKVDMNKDVIMSLSPLGERDSRYLTINAMEDLQIDKGSRLLGFFNAPEGKVQLKKEVYLRGAICAEEIDVDKDAEALYHLAGQQPMIPEWHNPVASTGDAAPDAVIQQNMMSFPVEFRLYQNFPNPFNPSTQITYTIPEDCHVTLKVFNMFGQEVRKLVDSEHSAGRYTVTWDATNDSDIRVPSGVYIYVLRTGKILLHGKMTLMK